MSNPTPGRWYVADENGNEHHNFEVHAEGGDEGPHILATVYVCGDHAAANARLMASAPALLDMLKKTRDRFFRCCTHAGNDVDMALAACKPIDALIARAEGRP